MDEEEPIEIYIEPGTATPDEIGGLLAEISKLYRMVGGSGLKWTIKVTPQKARLILNGGASNEHQGDPSAG